MKKNLLLLFAICIFLQASGQKKTKQDDGFYFLDKQHVRTTAGKAAYILHKVKKNDTCWQFEKYHLTGPLISLMQYSSGKEKAVLHGEASYFNKKGTLDSTGNFYKGRANGLFYYFDENRMTGQEKEFCMGFLITAAERHKRDSLKDEKEAVLFGCDIVEADFLGGQLKWRNYIKTHLQYPKRAIRLNKEGTVIIQFMIDKRGRTADLKIIQSVEYSLDQEALRIIKQSPAWKPASHFNGKRTISYKTQPLTFRLQ